MSCISSNVKLLSFGAVTCFFIVIQYVSFILLLMGGVGVAYTQPGLAHTTLIGATFVLEGVHGGSTPLFFYGSSYNTTK